MDYQFTPRYWRARLDVFREKIRESSNDSPDLSLLRNGVMRNSALEKMLIENQMNQQEYPNSPLTFVEQCSFNNWFSLHPDKICGEEIITTSREFPISIKGDRTWIQNTIGQALGENRLILPVPFEWRISYFDASDPEFFVEYTNDASVIRLYQGGIDYNLQIIEGDFQLENINYRELQAANVHILKYMQGHRGTTSSVTLELEALALELELQITTL
jgi:hypothetical protein